MSIFAIGDPHLSFGVQKPMDIFAGWDNYAERLRENWIEAVHKDDTVILVGDISWAMTLDEAIPDFRFFEELPGQKIILKGNHDYWWSTMRKMNDWLGANGCHSIRFLFNNAYIVENFGICGTRSWFYDENEPENEKVFARELGRLQASLAALDRTGCNSMAVFLHYPPIYRGRAVKEIVALLKKNNVQRCYYGHLHGASIPHAFNGVYDGILFQLVSADFLRFSPLKIL